MTAAQRQTWIALQVSRAMCEALRNMGVDDPAVLAMLPGVEQFAEAEFDKFPPLTVADARDLRERGRKAQAVVNAHGDLTARAHVAAPRACFQ